MVRDGSSVRSVSDHFKVLLVAPPIRRLRFNISGIYPMQPLGVASLASYLLDHGIEAEVLDTVVSKMTIEETAREILTRKPDLVGVSCTIFNMADAHILASRLKKDAPDLKILMGGYAVVFPPELMFKYMPEFDFFITGEGEKPLLELVRALIDNRDLGDVPSLYYRVNGEVLSNPPAPLLKPHEIPSPALELLPRRRYAMHPPFNVKPPFCLIESARGCGWHCNFCSISRKLRQKPVDAVLCEIANARSVFGANEIHFVDPTFPANPKRAVELAEAIGKDFPGLVWSCKSRVELIDEEIAGAFAKNGCYMISLGVETGTQRMLNSLSKGNEVKDIERCFAALKRFGIRSLVYIMFGLPGETEKDVHETLEFLMALEPDYVLFAGLMPDPRSALVAEYMDKVGFTMEDVFRLYYYGSAEGTPFSSVTMTGMPAKVVDGWVKEAYVRFYLRPKYMLRRLTSAKGLWDLLNLGAGAWALAKDAVAFNRLVLGHER